MDAVSFLFFDFDWVLTFCGFITFQTIKLKMLQGLGEKRPVFSQFYIIFYEKENGILSSNSCFTLTTKALILKTKHKTAKESSAHIHAEYVWSWESWHTHTSSSAL